MTGLDKLLEIAEEVRTNGYGPLLHRVLLAQRIEEVASEIEQDIFRAKVGEVDAKIGCAWRNLAKYMNDLLDGKYRDYGEPGIYRRSEGMDSFQEWLDKWYIPKPIGGDGNPISFDKLYDCGCGAIENINVFRCNGEYRYVVTSHDNISFFDMEDLHEQVPDSIEKLREDLCSRVHGCSIDDFYESRDCKECEVTEFLARAEKLFGGDAQ